MQREIKGRQEADIEQFGQINRLDQLNDVEIVRKLIDQERIIRVNKVVRGGGGASIEQYHIILSPIPRKLVEEIDYPAAEVDRSVIDLYYQSVKYRAKSFFVDEETGRMILSEMRSIHWKKYWESFKQGLKDAFRK